MIAIKGIEMPKRCIDCPFIKATGGVAGTRFFCNRIMKYFDENELESKPKDCPLVEIVTCRDCMYQYKDCEGNGICYINGSHRSDDFYCKDAERRQ